MLQTLQLQGGCNYRPAGQGIETGLHRPTNVTVPKGRCNYRPAGQGIETVR
ncbi:hypothetical protein CCP2SC5_930002 [Azospirillaceae bacterium]